MQPSESCRPLLQQPFVVPVSFLVALALHMEAEELLI